MKYHNKYCQWCGKPMGGVHGTRKYHQAGCAYDASRFKMLLVGNRGLPQAIKKHESAWVYLFRHLSEAEPDDMPRDILSPQEWELMMEILKWASVSQEPIPNRRRLIQLAAIGEQLLAMPIHTQWSSVPKDMRARISWYARQSRQWWKANPTSVIPEWRFCIDE